MIFTKLKTVFESTSTKDMRDCMRIFCPTADQTAVITPWL